MKPTQLTQLVLLLPIPILTAFSTNGLTQDATQTEVAVSKAEGLEEKASAEGGVTLPMAAETLTKAEVQAVDPLGQAPLDDAITCLARTIYWEAKGEGDTGMQAIANVVMNRLGHEGFPNTICEVAKQGEEQGSCQFSWWCDGRPDDVEEEEPYTHAKEIARKALNRQLNDQTDGALYFHHQQVTPSWAEGYSKTAEIGEHVFYKPVLGKAN